MKTIRVSYWKHSMFRIIALIVIFITTQYGNIFIQVINANTISSISFDNLCGDLLCEYAEKPDGLCFIDCKQDSSVYNEQLVCEATYRVDNKYAESIERFLIKKYGMGALRFVCCGWETVGKYGHIESERLRQINPNYIMSVNMYGSAEQINEIGELYLEKDRNKIKQFMVIVSIYEI